MNSRRGGILPPAGDVCLDVIVRAEARSKFCYITWWFTEMPLECSREVRSTCVAGHEGRFLDRTVTGCECIASQFKLDRANSFHDADTIGRFEQALQAARAHSGGFNTWPGAQIP